MTGAVDSSRSAFLRLWSAHSINVAGSTLAPVSVTLGLISHGVRSGTLSMTLAAGAAPSVLAFALSRSLATRLRPSAQTIAACILGAVGQLGLAAVFLSGKIWLGPLIALSFVTGLGSALYMPTVSRLVRSYVHAESRQSANARLSVSRSLAGTLGPAIGAGVTVLVGAQLALAVDGVSFIIAACLLASLPSVPAAPTVQHDADEAGQGSLLRLIARHPWLWSSLGAFAVGNLVTPTMFVVAPLIIAHNHRGALQWGLVLAFVGVGSVVGDVLMMRTKPARPLVLSRLMGLASVPLLLVIAWHTAPVLIFICAMGWGASKVVPDTLWYTAVQNRLDDRSMAQVLSFDWMTSIGLRPVGYLAAVPLSGVTGRAGTLFVCAAVLGLVSLLGLVPSDVRSFGNTVPALTPSIG